MNKINHNCIYVIINYELNSNLYEIVFSALKYCFAYCSLTQRNFFHLYFLFNNNYIRLFPVKNKDYFQILTANYSDVSDSIEKNLNDFFEKIETIEKIEKISYNKNLINIILKKILLEINSKNKFFNSDISMNQYNNLYEDTHIIIINDSENDFNNIDQKLVFLLKKAKTKFDIYSINSKNQNRISKSLCLFSGGFFDEVTNNKNNLTQVLIQEYIPIKLKNNLIKKNTDFNSLDNYKKLISERNFICPICHTELKDNCA